MNEQVTQLPDGVLFGSTVETTDPAHAPGAANPTAPPPANPPQPATPDPQKTEPAAPAAATAYTPEQLEEIRKAAVDDYKNHLAEATDYAKMTPEEKVVFLEAKQADTELSSSVTAQLQAAGLPLEALPFVKGKDAAESEERVKTFGAMLLKAANEQMAERLKEIGYTPQVGSPVSFSGQSSIADAVAEHFGKK